MRSLPALLVLCLALASCSRRTEEQRVKDLRASMSYRAYRLASDQGLVPLARQAEKRGGRTLNPRDMHGVMAVFWVCSDKPKLACAEADMYGESELAWAVRTIAFSKMDCPRLSQGQYELLKRQMMGQQGVTLAQADMQNRAFCVALVLVGLQMKEPDLARFGGRFLGAASQVDYIEPLVDALVESRQGNHAEAARKCEALSRTPGFAKHRAAILQELKAFQDLKPGDQAFEDLTRRLARGILEDVFGKSFLDEVAQQADKVKAL